MPAGPGRSSARFWVTLSPEHRMASTFQNRWNGSPNRWIGLVAASMGLFLGSLDITVNVALPEMTSSFDTDVETIQWIIVFYVGSTTALQLSLGSAADIYGLKRFYMLGVAVYTVAVLLIGLAPTLPMVFGLRVVQAVGNGLIMASAPALVTQMFPSQERGRALGLMAALGALGMVAGSLGGGALVDAFGWRSIFLARTPLCVLTLLLALVSIRPETREGSRGPFDLSGAGALLVGLGSLILTLTLGGRSGWGAPHVLGLGALAVAALGIFTVIEGRVPRPVLDLSLVKHRVLSPAVLSGYLMFAAVFVNWFILPFYVSDVLGMNAKALGLLLTLTPVASAVFSLVGGWISDRAPPAQLMTIALIVVAASMYWFSVLGPESTGIEVGFRMAAVGAGIGLFQAASANLIMGSMAAGSLGTGGAVMALSRSIGTVSSVALLGALFAARLDSHAVLLAVGTDTPSVFLMAFRDTYRVSAALVAVGALSSLALWPRFVGTRRTPSLPLEGE